MENRGRSCPEQRQTEFSDRCGLRPRRTSLEPRGLDCLGTKPRTTGMATPRTYLGFYSVWTVVGCDDFVRAIQRWRDVVNRRTILAGALVVALLGAGFSMSRGVHPALASRSDVDRAPVALAPSPPSTGTAAAEKLEESLAPERAASPAPLPQAVAPVLDIDPHEALGSKTAPVVVEIFSDFQCPACKTLFVTTNRQLMDDYVSTGKVYLIHRDFPLSHARLFTDCRALRSRRRADRQGRAGGRGPVPESGKVGTNWRRRSAPSLGVLSTAEMGKVRALVKSGTAWSHH